MKARLGYFWVLFIVFFQVSQAWGDTFLGCADYCRMKSGISKLAPGQTAGYGMMREYDNCVIQSQQEGYCGRKPKAEPSPSPSPSPAKSASPTPSPSPSVALDKSTPSASVCINQFNAAISNCGGDYSTAASVCNTDSNPALKSAMSAASTASLAVSQQTGGSLQAACSNMGTVGQVSSGALAAYRVTCQQVRNTCVTSCSAAKQNLDECVANAQTDFAGSFVGYSDKVQAQTDFRQKVEADSSYKSVATQLSQCNSLQTNIDQATQAIQNMAATAVNAQNCAALTAAGQASAAGVTASASTTGTALSFCQQNPADPSCQSGSGSQAAQGISSSGGGVAKGASNSAAAASLNLPAANNGIVPGAGAGGNNGAPAEDPGGKKGNGVVLGDGGLTPAGKAGGGASLNAGRYAYQGPGGFFGTSGASAMTINTNSGSGESAFKETPKNSDQAMNPDLQKYLPGGLKDPGGGRGMAGDLVGPDGITGPYSDLWMKVQNRYRIMGTSLLP